MRRCQYVDIQAQAVTAALDGQFLGHAIDGMPQHYATATVARLVEAANKVTQTRDRTTLLRVVNG